jgi:hypothetical protein
VREIGIVSEVGKGDERTDGGAIRVAACLAAATSSRVESGSPVFQSSGCLLAWVRVGGEGHEDQIGRCRNRFICQSASCLTVYFALLLHSPSHVQPAAFDRIP